MTLRHALSATNKQLFFFQLSLMLLHQFLHANDTVKAKVHAALPRNEMKTNRIETQEKVQAGIFSLSRSICSVTGQLIAGEAEMKLREIFILSAKILIPLNHLSYRNGHEVESTLYTKSASCVWLYLYSLWYKRSSDHYQQMNFW